MNKKAILIVLICLIALFFMIARSKNNADEAKKDSFNSTDFDANYKNYEIAINTKDSQSKMLFFVNDSGSKKYLKNYAVPGMIFKSTINKISDESYEFGVNITNIPSNIKGFGIDIISNDSEIRKDNNVFSIQKVQIDFNNILYLNPVISNNSVYIPINGDALYFDPSINFTTSNVGSMAVSPLGNHTLVVAWCDGSNAYAKIYDTNGTNITGNLAVGASSGCDYNSVAVTALNTTHFVVARYDYGQQTDYFYIYNSTGTAIVSSGTIEAATGYAFSISLTAFNNTHWIAGWWDRDEQDCTFSVFKDGTKVAGPIDAETSCSDSSYVTSVAALNSTHFVIAWYEGSIGTASWKIYNSSLQQVTSGSQSLSGVGSGSVSVAALNSTHFVISWYDPNTIKFDIWKSNGTKLYGPISVSTNSYANLTSLAAINSTHFVIGFFEKTAQAFAIYDSTGTLKKLQNSTTGNAAGYHSLAVASYLPAVDVELCSPTFIHAYQISATSSNWTSYLMSGSIWSGICSSNPPVYSNIANAPSPFYSANTSMQVNTTWDTATTVYFENNFSGSWSNKTGVSLGSSVWSNTTTGISQTKGKIISWRSFGGDDFGRWNVTSLQNITVSNTPPSIASTSIAPATAYTLDDLNCSASGWSDSDSDSPGYYFNWYKGTVLNQSYGSQSTSWFIFNEGNTTSGDSWTCGAVPYDGTANGTEVNSSAVVIQNSAPTWSNVQEPTDPSMYVDGATYQFFNVTVSDPDSVSQIHTVIFQFNNTNYTLTAYDTSGNNRIYYKSLTNLAARTSYSYKWYMNDTSNAWNSTGTYTFTITQQPTKVTVLINDTDGDVSNYKGIFKLNATINVSTLAVYLYTNITGWGSDKSGTPTVQNISNITVIGKYNVTGYYNGNENYTASSATHFLTTSGHVPTVSGINWITQGGSTSSSLRYNQIMSWIKANASDLDGDLSFVNVTVKKTSGALAVVGMPYNMTLESSPVYNYTTGFTLDENGTWTIYVDAFDTDLNKASTSAQFSVTTSTPGLIDGWFGYNMRNVSSNTSIDQSMVYDYDLLEFYQVFDTMNSSTWNSMKLAIHKASQDNMMSALTFQFIGNYTNGTYNTNLTNNITTYLNDLNYAPLDDAVAYINIELLNISLYTDSGLANFTNNISSRIVNVTNNRFPVYVKGYYNTTSFDAAYNAPNQFPYINSTTEQNFIQMETSLLRNNATLNRMYENLSATTLLKATNWHVNIIGKIRGKPKGTAAFNSTTAAGWWANVAEINNNPGDIIVLNNGSSWLNFSVNMTGSGTPNIITWIPTNATRYDAGGAGSAGNYTNEMRYNDVIVGWMAATTKSNVTVFKWENQTATDASTVPAGATINSVVVKYYVEWDRASDSLGISFQNSSGWGPVYCNETATAGEHSCNITNNMAWTSAAVNSVNTSVVHQVSSDSIPLDYIWLQIKYTTSGTGVRNGYDVWDDTGHFLITKNSNSNITVEVSPYNATYVIFSTGIDHIIFYNNSKQTVYAQSSGSTGLSSYVEGASLTAQMGSAGGNSETLIELWDPTYVEWSDTAPTFISHYEWLNASLLPSYSGFKYIIIADNVTSQINQYIGIGKNTSIYGYIAVNDYTDTQAWEDKKKTQINNWENQWPGINIFIDGIDIGAAGSNFTARMKELVDYIRYEKGVKSMLNSYTTYQEFAEYGDVLMKESCFSRWGTVANPCSGNADGKVNLCNDLQYGMFEVCKASCSDADSTASPVYYTWEDFELEIIRSNWNRLHNEPVVCMSFGPRNDTSKSMYDWAAFLVIYGTDRNNSWRYGQPNFQLQEQVKVFDPGQMLDYTYTNTSTTDYWRRYENGVIHINPQTHTWSFEQGRTINYVQSEWDVYNQHGSGNGNNFTFNVNSGQNNTFSWNDLNGGNVGAAGWVLKNISQSDIDSSYGKYYLMAWTGDSTGGAALYTGTVSGVGSHSFNDSSTCNPYGGNGVGTNCFPNWNRTMDRFTSPPPTSNNWAIRIRMSYTNSKSITDMGTITRTDTITGDRMQINYTASKSYNMSIWDNGTYITTNLFKNVTVLNGTSQWYQINASYTDSCNSTNPTWNNTVVSKYGGDDTWGACYMNISSTQVYMRLKVPHLSTSSYNVTYNTAPTISSVTDQTGGVDSSSTNPTNAGSNINFTAVWSDSESDSSQLHICTSNSLTGLSCTANTLCDNLTWSTSGMLYCINVTNANMDSGGAGSSYYAFVCDNTSYCSSSLSGTYFINHVPILTANPAINNSNPKTNDVLNCNNGTFSDPDGDVQGNNAWRWFKDSGSGYQIVAGQTGQTLDGATYFGKGDKIICEQTAKDQHNFGTNAYNSSSVTVINSAPTLSSASLTPATAYKNSTLNCSASGAADDDGDTVRYYFNWYKPANSLNLSVGDTAISWSTLNSGNLTKNDVWKCGAIPYDYTNNGTQVNSSTVTIQNTAPEKPSASLSPLTAYTNTTFTCSGSSSDIDGDSLTYYYIFNDTGGTLQAESTTATYSCNGAGCDKNDIVTCVSRAYDGTAYSSYNVSNAVTVSNLPPSTPTTLTPTTGTWGGNNKTISIACSGSAGTDPDGDTAYYHIEAYYDSGWHILQSQGDGNYNWDISGINSQTGVDLQCSATDTFDSSSFYNPAGTITIDNTGPNITIQSPTNTSYSSTNNIWANVTLNQTGSWCGSSLDGGSNTTMANSTGNYNNLMSGVSKQTHDVIFYCNNSMGNMAKNDVNFTVSYGNISVSSCQELNTANSNYTLSTDVSSADNCFNISAIGVTLDCGGHKITYATSNSGVGINVSSVANNFTITNCNIVIGSLTVSSENSGIDFSPGASDSAGSVNDTIQNVNITITGAGANWATCVDLDTNYTIVNNLRCYMNSSGVTTNPATGIDMDNAWNNTIINSYIEWYHSSSACCADAIRMNGGTDSYNNISFNVINVSQLKGHGIFSSYTTATAAAPGVGNNFYNNTIYMSNNTASLASLDTVGIVIYGAASSGVIKTGYQIVNNTIIGNYSSYAIEVRSGVSGILIENNTIKMSNGASGTSGIILFDGVNSSTVKNNNITVTSSGTNNVFGIEMGYSTAGYLSSFNNTLQSNIVDTDYADALLLVSGISNTQVIGGTYTSPNGNANAGVFTMRSGLQGGVNGTWITNANFTDKTTGGTNVLYFDGTSITNNTFWNSTLNGTIYYSASSTDSTTNYLKNTTYTTITYGAATPAVMDTRWYLDVLVQNATDSIPVNQAIVNITNITGTGVYNGVAGANGKIGFQLLPDISRNSTQIIRQPNNYTVNASQGGFTNQSILYNLTAFGTGLLTISLSPAVGNYIIVNSTALNSTTPNPTESLNTTLMVTVNVTNSSAISTCDVRIFNTTGSWSSPIFSYTGTLQLSGSQWQCTKTFGVEFYRNPGQWNVSVNVSQSNALNFTSINFTYGTLAGLEANASAMTFTGTPGQTVNGVNGFPLQINNTGNAQITMSINASDFTYGSSTITVGNLTYNTTAAGDVFVSATKSMSTMFTNVPYGPSITRTAWFKGIIPSVKSYSYTGTIWVQGA